MSADKTELPLSVPAVLNELQWQNWLSKNRERDRLARLKRMRFLEILALLGVIATALVFGLKARG